MVELVGNKRSVANQGGTQDQLPVRGELKVSSKSGGVEEMRTRVQNQIRGEQDISSRKRVTRYQEQIREIGRKYRENN